MKIKLNCIKMKNRNILLIIVFTSIAQLFYGQERYTIRGEFPDHSLDNEYVLLYEQSALPGESERSKQAFIDSILVVDKKFHYEGKIDRKPFLASISGSKGRYFRYNTTFVVEPGDIQLRIVDWGSEGNVSGTLINDDYNTYIIERGNQLHRMRLRKIEQEEIAKNGTHTKDNKRVSFIDAYEHAEEGRYLFLKKYAQYPDVIRYWLALYIDSTNPRAKENNLSRFLHIVDLMPKADRDILLAWREYKIKLKEYMKKTKALRDSVDANKPRFVETIPSNSPTTTKSE